MTRTERMELWDTVRIPDWLESDTEESIVGTEWHQMEQRLRDLEHG